MLSNRSSGDASGIAKIAAIGSHAGASVYSGHWTAAHRTRGENDNPNARGWRIFNDEIVRQAPTKMKGGAAKVWRNTATVFAYTTAAPSCTSNKTKTKS